jgi:lysophospholipase L1-like esterase
VRIACLLAAFVLSLSCARAAPAICPEAPQYPADPAQWDRMAARAGTPEARALMVYSYETAVRRPPDPKGDVADLCRYRAADAVLRAAGTKVRMVFMGDSITELWAQANPKLFAGAFIDRGISGQLTWQMLVRFRQDVIDLHPRVVHILGGTNDLVGLSGATTLAEIEGNIETMIELAQAHGIKVVVGAVPPMGPPLDTPDRKREVLALNAWLAETARREGLGFADYYAVLSDSTGALNTQLSIDSLHPNRFGFEEMEALMRFALSDVEPAPRKARASAPRTQSP